MLGDGSIPTDANPSSSVAQASCLPGRSLPCKCKTRLHSGEFWVGVIFGMDDSNHPYLDGFDRPDRDLVDFVDLFCAGFAAETCGNRALAA
jgi:hypothetical protein